MKFQLGKPRRHGVLAIGALETPRPDYSPTVAAQPIFGA